MAEFTDEMMQRVIANEGAEFENDPNDEPTKYGIVGDDIRECVEDGILSKSALDDIVEFIKNIDRPMASKILKHQYFDKLMLDKLLDQSIAEKIFDMAMPIGRKAAVVCAQRACRSVTAGNKELEEDGIMGQNTLAFINICFNKNFLSAYRSECAGYFRAIAMCKESKVRYLKGWLKRSYE